MDIEHSASPAIDELFAEDTHVACKRDIFRASLMHRFFHCGIMIRTFHTLVREREGRNALGLCQFQSARIGFVACDKNNFVGGAWLSAGVKERGHIGAAAGDKDGNLGLISGVFRQSALPPSLLSRSTFLAIQ